MSISFSTETQTYIDPGRRLEKPRKRLREEGGGGRREEKTFTFPPPPLKSVFDSSQLSGRIDVQDGGTTSFPKTNHGSRPNTPIVFTYPYHTDEEYIFV